MVAANEPVPEPVTSPVSVIVWSPVLVPERLLTFVCSASEYSLVSELDSYAVFISVAVWSAVAPSSTLIIVRRLAGVISSITPAPAVSRPSILSVADTFCIFA